MKQLPTEGKKFKVVDGRKAKLQMRKWFDLFVLLEPFGAMYLLYLRTTNKPSVSSFIVPFSKDVEAVTFRLECQTYLSRFC